MLSEPALWALTRTPGFRAVAEAAGAEAIAHFQRLDPVSRWLLKDLGRTSIYVAAFVLHLLPGGLTLSGLITPLVAMGAASRSRIVAFVDHALETGRLEVAPGSAPWTQRRLIPRPVFVDVLRDRLAGAMTAIGPIDGAIARAASMLSDDGALAAAYINVAQTTALVRTVGAPRLAHIEFFMARDAGLKVLQDLLGRQDPGRARLLEVATFSRTVTARCCGVSRVHLNTLLEDAQARGWLTRIGRNVVAFDPALNDSYELWVAMQIQGARLVARAILAR